MHLIAASVLVAATHGCRVRREPAQVLVTNEDSGDVTVIDADRDEIVRTIHVGKRPRGLRVSADGKLLFVALSGTPKAPPPDARLAAAAPVHVEGQNADPPADPERDVKRDDAADGIAIVDLGTGTLVRVLSAGRDPEAFDVTPDGKTLWVSNEETAEVSVVDVASGRVRRTVPVGPEPEGVTVGPDGRFVYVTSEASNEIDVIRTSGGGVERRIPTGLRPRAIAFGPDGAHAYVTAELGGVLHIVDATSHAAVGQVGTGKPGVKPMGVAISPDGTHAYVANGREGSVAVIDVATRRLARTIDGVGARPWGIAITPNGKKLYVAAGPDVAVIDIARGAVIKRLAGGRGPWGVAIARGRAR
jgi:YVTN family beta-propeller protein